MGQKTKPFPALGMNGLHYRFFRDDIFYSVIDWCIWKIQGFRVQKLNQGMWALCGLFLTGCLCLNGAWQGL